MTNHNKEQNPDAVPRSSAPELPEEIAAQYGVSRRVVSTGRRPESEPISSPSPEAEEAPLGRSIDEDSETDKDVDAIVATEGDQLLDMQGDIPEVSGLVPRKRGILAGMGRWWHNKWARYLTIFGFLLAIGAVAALPVSRYKLLNAAGVRSSASVTVLDETSGQPLKNVSVMLEGKKAMTDRNGVASFGGLKLGNATLTVSHVAFATLNNSLVVGWGSNSLAPVQLHPTGIQYTILVTDYVSGKPLAGVEADTSDAAAIADNAGKITLTENTENPALSVTLSEKGYNTLTTTLNASSTSSFHVALVPAGSDVFVAKHNGVYNVYAANLDGSSQKLVLAGTGLEGPDMSLVVSPDGSQAALVSTRDNTRDSEGNLLEALTLINIKQGTSITLDHAEQIQLIDWIGNQLVYATTAVNTPTLNSQRQQVIVYNTVGSSRVQLATADQFNVILSAKGAIYYAMSSADPKAQLGLFKINPDGTSRQNLSSTEVLSGLRTGYSTLSVQTASGWSAYDLSAGTFTASQAPSASAGDEFVDSADGTKSVWADVVNGRSTLQLLTIASGKSTTLQAAAGITAPYRWTDASHILYRVSSESGAADYLTSASGGTAHKIADVIATDGYAQVN